MKKIDEFWVDENNNKWDAILYTKREAEQMSKTLIGCTNCKNCTHCEDCVNCEGCRDCTDCEDCVNCQICTHCTKCEDCTICTKCECCTHCTHCEDCTICTKCECCTHCTHCEDCKDCEDCTYCTDCTICVRLYIARKYDDQPVTYMTNRMGSRNGITYMYCGNIGDKKSVQVVCGCFRGDLDEFEAAVKKTHGDNEHGKAYMAEIQKAKKLFGLE